MEESTTEQPPTTMEVENIDNNAKLNTSQEEDENPDPDKDVILAENMTLEEKN